MKPQRSARRLCTGLLAALPVALGVMSSGACTLGADATLSTGSAPGASGVTPPPAGAGSWSSGAPGPASIGSSGPIDPAVALATVSLERLVDRRAEALRRRDRQAWAQTVDPMAAEPAAEMASYDGLVALGVLDLEVGPVVAVHRAGVGSSPPGSGSGSDGVWTGTVRLGYRLAGFDRGVRSVARSVTVRADAGVWSVVRGIGPEDTWEPWDLPGVAAVRTGRVLVVGNVPLDVLVDRAAEADVALADVTGLLGAGPRAVVVVPRSAADTARLLGQRELGGQRQVAATTVGGRDPEAPALADRVVLSADGWARLTPAGRRAVITHELAHVVLRATTVREAPLWLSEGVAEWVAYRNSGLDVRVVAAQLLSEVRDVGPPLGLPQDNAFDPAGTAAVPAYQASWLAVARIAREHGADLLLRLYRDVAGSVAAGPEFGARGPGGSPGSSASPATGRVGDPAPGDLARRVEAAFVSNLGESRAQFVINWRAELVALARG